MSLQPTHQNSSPEKQTDHKLPVSMPVRMSARMRNWFQAQGRYWALAWQEFQQSKGYRWMKASSKLLVLILFTIFGLGVYQIVAWLLPLLPKLAWLTIALGIVNITQELAIHFLGRFHERKVTLLEREKGILKREAHDEVIRYRNLASHAQHQAEAYKNGREVLKSELQRLTADYDSLTRELSDLTGHKVIATVIRTSSQVYSHKHSTWNCPVVRAQIALRFENRIADDIAIKDLSLGVYERADSGSAHELPIKGAKPSTVLLPREDLSREVEIAGLTVKGFGYSPTYFLMDEMVVDIYEPELTNGKHFLRLTLTAVAQKPYIVDIEVDWPRPSAFILSAKPIMTTE